MKQLKDILFGVPLKTVSGSTAVQISGVAFDSRAVTHQSLFVAIKGTHHDGHAHINDAVKHGAVAVLCEQFPDVLADKVVYVLCENTCRSLATVASQWYDTPSKALKLIGITGTNGKTSVATMAYQLFDKMGFATGLLSTVEVRVKKKMVPSTHTTPNPLAINKHLSEMVAVGVTHCFMEVSSHGIDQDRIADLHFSGGVFTNLSHDHLDYHKDFKSYRDTKKIFFDGLASTAFALASADDKNGRYMLQNTKASKHYFGLKSVADFHVKVLEKDFSGMLLKLQQNEVWTPLVGTFNASNFISVYAIAELLDIEQSDFLPVLSTLKGAAGRFQIVHTGRQITAIVDYAHTPDALKSVLETLQPHLAGELHVVFGCGGDRDPGKRVEMGRCAAAVADHVVLTDDNPRSEDPAKIRKAARIGCPDALEIGDRAEAITAGVKALQPGDILVVAGKGHEPGQIVGNTIIPFDDADVVRQVVQ